MPRHYWRLLILAIIGTWSSGELPAKEALNWAEVQELFHRNNPNWLAGQIGVRESQANEITAGLRPNPTFATSNDQFLVFSPGRLNAWEND